MHLDLACTNFGIQEQNVFSPTTQEVFPGCPEIKGGYKYFNDRPALGIDLNEQLAAQFPYQSPGRSRWNDRRLDSPIVQHWMHVGPSLSSSHLKMQARV